MAARRSSGLLDEVLPVGKLPAHLLARILNLVPHDDPQVVFGPSPGLDCAVVDVGSTLLVFKSDPITFATADIGWYLVQVNANDIATTGALPRWFLLTLLLPEGEATAEMAMRMMQQIQESCQAIGASLIGGHTEITYGLQRPIAVGTLIGQVKHGDLVMPTGARPGDRLLLTKGLAVEATAILAREFPDKLATALSPAQLETAKDFLFSPGISVLRDAQTALKGGRVTAMHDPTEGGLAAALWELAEASNHSMFVDLGSMPMPEISRAVCDAFGIDPMAAISSGALLLAVEAGDSDAIRAALKAEGIVCAEIGEVKTGPPVVWYSSEGRQMRLERPTRDELAQLFES